ncbi:exported protein of unknown function [Candidatus Promineifilum breve]|uniref:Uncharacterized protein n=1 Tax=Candidatus Promineifilum breve TaxID=1806508 RepID=A0A161KDA2_9CHLR|nr:exported protein of unknown function [Candidatus Promineifilum breve]
MGARRRRITWSEHRTLSRRRLALLGFSPFCASSPQRGSGNRERSIPVSQRRFSRLPAPYGRFRNRYRYRNRYRNRNRNRNRSSVFRLRLRQRLRQRLRGGGGRKSDYE